MIARLGTALARSCSALLVFGATAGAARPQAVSNPLETGERVRSTVSSVAAKGEQRGEARRADSKAPTIAAIKAAWLRRQKAANTVKCEWVETRNAGGVEHTLNYSLRLKDVDKLFVCRRGRVREF